MPGYLLHQGATVVCPHNAGRAQPILRNRRVKINRQPIVTRSMYRITGCPNPPPPENVGPCQTAEWITAATRVKASGIPVLLRDSKSTCTPTPEPLKILSTQTRVKGI